MDVAAQMKIQNKKIVYFSRFHPKSDGDGGYRRTFQIYKALNDIDFHFISSRDFEQLTGNRCTAKFDKSPCALARQLDIFYKLFVTNGTYKKWGDGARENLFLLNYISKVW